ncbi:TetR/AcrR family transcriptional regulator [Streptomyces fenghuangensis]|uniref:TetR/AcrR family transcriptional regulator n=1 Tax=Streptomyces chitinivorans TaxID=1257027 RepID=A0ABW7HMD9_9ACTN|nr:MULTISPECIES: TetR/AcrR family transcriptional regulator [Streptomyces]MCG3041587.1 TetR/AcrR family transcriptional regulator [Streptomyces sp. ICN903]MDH2410496.1 TetR/AcrR family transcriptional regulator [Streptomyces chitinivorans]
MPKQRTLPADRVDPRVLRTRALLREAALAIAAERDVESMTIADIAERATVNRATVYQHYRDRDALLLDAMEEEVGRLARAAARCPLTHPAQCAPGELAQLFRHVETNATLYRRMLGPGGSARFVNRLRELLAEEVAAQLGAAGGDGGNGGATAPLLELRAHYLAGAFVGVFTRWVAMPGRPTAEQAAEEVWGLLRGASPDRGAADPP